MKNQDADPDYLFDNKLIKQKIKFSSVKNYKYLKIKKHNDILSNYQTLSDSKDQNYFETCYDLNKPSYFMKIKQNSSRQTLNHSNNKNEVKEFPKLCEEENDKLFLTNSNFNKFTANKEEFTEINFNRHKLFLNTNPLREMIKDINKTKKKIENESKDIQKMLLFTKKAKEDYKNVIKNNYVLPKIHNKHKFY